jgi:hypothetical protein
MRMYLKRDADWPAHEPWRAPRREQPEVRTAERDLLWCLRRQAMLRPLGSARDAHVHLLLQRRFGDAGLGLEHLLRCLIVGLARRALRPVALNLPCRSAISEDERRLLWAMANVDRPARAAALLAPIAGTRGVELIPLLAAIAALLPR